MIIRIINSSRDGACLIYSREPADYMAIRIGDDGIAEIDSMAIDGVDVL